MLKVEPISGPYELPEDALCLTPHGWKHVPHEVILQFQGMTLSDVMQAIWTQHGGLLGVGDLVFKQTAAEPNPKGFVVFFPQP